MAKKAVLFVGCFSHPTEVDSFRLLWSFQEVAAEVAEPFFLKSRSKMCEYEHAENEIKQQ